MSSIAERANSCIGSLYQFFPNKHSVAEALRDEYVKEIEQSWIALGCQAPSLSAEDLTCRLIKLQVEIIKSHPALLALLDVPAKSHKRRQVVRARIASVLIAHKPRMPEKTALRVASVVQQVSKGLFTLYAQAAPDEKNAMIEEFKSVLTGYLTPKLKC
jgi:AcrR family transcriptional regulator